MDLTKIIGGLQKTLDVVETLMPIASAIGGSTVDSIGRIISAGVSIANNTLERVQEGAVVASENDEAKLRGIIRELQAKNDELAKAIANS